MKPVTAPRCFSTTSSFGARRRSDSFACCAPGRPASARAADRRAGRSAAARTARRPAARVPGRLRVVRAFRVSSSRFAPRSASSASITSADLPTSVSCCACDSRRRSGRACPSAWRRRCSALRCARDFAIRMPTRLARLLVRGVLAAPAAVLAHLDPVRRVSPRLVRLVVAPFALLAGEGYCDSDVSASHLLLKSSWAARQTESLQKKDLRRHPTRRATTRGAEKDSATRRIRRLEPRAPSVSAGSARRPVGNRGSRAYP